MADILILTGPPGAGKSSVAEALADRYDRVAHVNVDTLRHFITPTGYRAPGKDGFERQHALAVHNACDLARNYMAERFAVIIDDVVPARADLDLYLDTLTGVDVAVHFVRLLPTRAVCHERNRGRRADRVPSGRLDAVYDQFEAGDETRGSVIDSSDMTVEATADRLQALTTSGASIVPLHGRHRTAAHMTQVVIRKREPDDDAWIAALLSEWWGSARVVSRGRMHDPMALPGFVAMLAGQVAGLATYNIEGDACELVTLNSILEGRGVGTALIGAVADAARAQGAQRLWLITTNDNTKALGFYQRRGLLLVAIHRDAIVESRRLKPEIPEFGLDGVPIRDEMEMELDLS